MLDHVVNDIPMCTLSSATTTPPGRWCSRTLRRRSR
jgi:hypothetical protein